VSSEGSQRNVGGRPPTTSRQAVIETALDLLRTDGLAALTLAAIGERLGMHKAAIYTYAKSKEDLLLAMRDEVNGRLLEGLRADVDLAPEVALKSMCARLGAIMTDYGQLMISVEPDLVGPGLDCSELFLEILARLGLAPEQQHRVHLVLASSVTSIVAGATPSARRRAADAQDRFQQTLAENDRARFPRLSELFSGRPADEPARLIEDVVSLVVDVLIPAIVGGGMKSGHGT
jgi:AcrR family transcriptional regulator